MLFAVEDATILAAITMVLAFLSASLTAFLQYKMSKLAQDVKEVKHATNSMHEEIVSKTKEAATRQGADDERARATAEVATLARGALAEKERSASSPTSEHLPIAETVEEVKDDVKIVKRDVRDVHAKVVEEVKTGVQRGIEESKELQ